MPAHNRRAPAGLLDADGHALPKAFLRVFNVEATEVEQGGRKLGIRWQRGRAMDLFNIRTFGPKRVQETGLTPSRYAMVTNSQATSLCGLGAAHAAAAANAVPIVPLPGGSGEGPWLSALVTSDCLPPPAKGRRNLVRLH
jgi:hypothetical protein